MTLEGWIFMVGLRVFDIGALIVWLIWFFRLRDDDDDADDGRGGGGSTPEPETPKGPSGRPAAAAPGRRSVADSRRRDHGGDLCPSPATSRRGVPEPVPARAPVKRR